MERIIELSTPAGFHADFNIQEPIDEDLLLDYMVKNMLHTPWIFLKHRGFYRIGKFTAALVMKGDYLGDPPMEGEHDPAEDWF